MIKELVRKPISFLLNVYLGVSMMYDEIALVNKILANSTENP
jgi:hypothetical protein